MKSILTLISVWLIAGSHNNTVAQVESLKQPTELASAEKVSKLQGATDSQASENGEAYLIIDPENLFTPEQKEQIANEQKQLLIDHDCLVSYAIYGIQHSENEIVSKWEQLSSNNNSKFHLLITLGKFLDKHIVNIHYQNPPLLDDINEVENILERATKDIQSEVKFSDVLNKSYVAINDELAYLSTRPIVEQVQSEKVEAIKDAQFKSYVIKIVKIVMCVLVPLIIIITLWRFITKYRNSLPHYFPETRSVPRLGAPHGATSIHQTSP